MRFFKEFNGFIFEFKSFGGYFGFLIGRLLGVIIFFGMILLILFLFSLL